MRLDPKSQPVRNLLWGCDPDIVMSQPQRYAMNFARIARWERVKEASSRNKYDCQRRIRDMTPEQTFEALTDAVRNMNNWLHKKSAGDHPNSVFVNFLKKSLALKMGDISLLNEQCKDGFNPANIIVDIKDNRVADLHFYDSNWPIWGKDLLIKVRAAAASLDYKELSGVVITTQESNVKEVMSGLDRLANFSFQL